MIQRIQTVYLLLVVILGITLLFTPGVQFATPDDAAEHYRVWNLYATHMTLTHSVADTEASSLSESPLQGLWGLALAASLIPLLALVDIFLYKRRILQARLNIFTALLCLGYYGVLAIYIWLGKMALNMDWYILPWAAIPLVCFVLTLMATRRILADEALVRSADRLR